MYIKNNLVSLITLYDQFINLLKESTFFDVHADFYYENNISCYEPLDNQGHPLYTGKGNIHCHSSLIYAYLFSFHIYMIFIDVHIYLICRH